MRWGLSIQLCEKPCLQHTITQQLSWWQMSTLITKWSTMVTVEVAPATSNWRTTRIAHTLILSWKSTPLGPLFFEALKWCSIFSGIHLHKFGLWELQQGSPLTILIDVFCLLYYLCKASRKSRRRIIISKLMQLEPRDRPSAKVMLHDVLAYKVHSRFQMSHKLLKTFIELRHQLSGHVCLQWAGLLVLRCSWESI